VAMPLEILTPGVKNPWLTNLPCVRKARYSYIFQAKIPPQLCQLKHLHPFNVLCLWFTCPSLFLRLLERNHPPSKIQVSHIILISKSKLIFLKPEWTILVHDVIWTLLGSFSDITSFEGDEEITWNSENNKPILRVLLVYLFSFFSLINDLIILQSNFTLPTALSTSVGTSAASVLSTNSGVSGASASQFVPLATSVQPQGSSKFAYTAEQTKFADALQIPSELRRTGTSLTLQQHYARYLAYLKALTTLKKMNKDGTWPEGLRVPSDSDIRLLFIGKSTWHDSWSKTFPHLKDYPDMKNWLADDEDCLDDVDLWDSNLKSYHFPELILWLKQGGSLKKGAKKGAAKEASTSGPSTSKSAAKASTSKKSNSSAKKAPARKASTSKAGNSKSRK